jgi:hypothetical protein
MESNRNYNFVIIPIDHYSLDPSLVIDTKKEMLSEFICIVCHHLVIKPKMCKKCQKVFCGRCINKTLNFTDKCPQRCDYKEVDLPRPLRNMLYGLKLRCPFDDCNETDILYERMMDHLNMCQYMQKKTKCLGCKFIYPLIDIEEHVRNCSRIWLTCEFCNRPVLRKDYDEHESLCEDKIVLCNDCGMAYKRSNIKTHSKEECDKNYQIKLNYDTGLDKDKPYINPNIECPDDHFELKNSMSLLVGKYTCMTQIYTLDNELILAVGSDMSKIILFNLRDSKKLIFEGHNGAIMCLIQYEDLLISGSYDNDIKIWDLNSSVCIKTLNGHTGGITSIIIQNGFIISSSMDKSIRMWRLQDFSPAGILDMHKYTVSSIIPIDEDTIASSSYDKSIRVWDIKNKKCLAQLVGHSAEIESLIHINTIKYKNYLFSNGYDVIMIWDLRTYQCIKEIKTKSLIYNLFEIYNDILAIVMNDNITLFSIQDLKFQKLKIFSKKCKEMLPINNLEKKQLFALRNDKKIDIYENFIL